MVEETQNITHMIQTHTHISLNSCYTVAFTSDMIVSWYLFQVNNWEYLACLFSMLGHLPSGFLGGNKVMELQPLTDIKWSMGVHTYTTQTHTHTAECTKAVKATTPSARCYPRLDGVSVRSLSHLCYSRRQVSVTPRRERAKNPHSINSEHNHLPCCISIQLRHTFIQLLWSFRRNHNEKNKK